MLPSSPSADYISDALLRLCFGRAVFLLPTFPENWGVRLRISGGCPARGEPEALINPCSSIAWAAEPPQRCFPVQQVQQRRPPPAAETGRSCWGRGQQDMSATQGTKWSLGTATRLSEAASIFGPRQPLRGLKGASSPFLVGPCPCRAKHAAFASQTGLSA